jgi:benzodiazapine receptor
VAALSVASLGGLATELGPWYYSLRMPAWKPPDWLFGPAWTLIYGLSAMAAVSAWWNSRNRANRFRILLLFAVNSLLGIAWSVLFFQHAPSRLGVVRGHFPVALDRRLDPWAVADLDAASWLLAPYLLWVSFAAVLNLAVVQLNFVSQ